jgi:hypothetical protein
MNRAIENHIHLHREIEPTISMYTEKIIRQHLIEQTLKVAATQELVQ